MGGPRRADDRHRRIRHLLVMVIRVPTMEDQTMGTMTTGIITMGLPITRTITSADLRHDRICRRRGMKRGPGRQAQKVGGGERAIGVGMDGSGSGYRGAGIISPALECDRLRVTWGPRQP